MNETNLNYEYIKDQPEALNIQAKGQFSKTQDIVIHLPDRFQRISLYENGVIICEEIYNGKQVFRFNYPYTEVEPGKLIINN